jgi:hypothetical protein
VTATGTGLQGVPLLLKAIQDKIKLKFRNFKAKTEQNYNWFLKIEITLKMVFKT